MTIRLQDDFRAGRPINQVPASWFAKVARILNGLRIVDARGRDIGKVNREASGRGWTLVILSSVFSGVVYVNGVRYAGLNATGKKWVCVPLDGRPPFECDPPTYPFPVNEEYYEKAFTAGDIHVIGTR